nr:hypothetical protein [Nanoarchaeum sp.]
MISTNIMIAQGASLFQNTGSFFMAPNSTSKQLKDEILSERIKEFMIGRNSVRISDLVVNLNERADNIIKSIKILKEKGYIEEIN